MGARHVTGLLRLGGGSGEGSKLLIEFNGELDPKCFEALKLEIERLARECGLKVKAFGLGKKIKKKAKTKKKKK